MPCLLSHQQTKTWSALRIDEVNLFFFFIRFFMVQINLPYTLFRITTRVGKQLYRFLQFFSMKKRHKIYSSIAWCGSLLCFEKKSAKAVFFYTCIRVFRGGGGRRRRKNKWHLEKKKNVKFQVELLFHLSEKGVCLSVITVSLQ